MTYAAHESGVSRMIEHRVQIRKTFFQSILKASITKSHNMLLSKRTATQFRPTIVNRAISTSSRRMAATKRRAQDEIHRPSLSGSSVGHLFSEINAMRPGMEALRADGMSEDQRTYARKTATWLMGVPVVLGTLIVGGNWLLKDRDDEPRSA